MALERRNITKKIVTEEEFAVAEEGEAGCPHCGGELKEEYGVFKCIHCGKEAGNALMKKELAEKKVSPQELKDFGSKIKALTIQELADYCFRLFSQEYGEVDLCDRIRAHPEKYDTAMIMNSLENLDLHLRPATFIKDRGTAFVFIAKDRRWLLFYCSTKTIDEKEAELVMKAAEKLKAELFFVVPMGVDKKTEEILEDYADIKTYGVQDLYAHTKKNDVKLKTTNPALGQPREEDLSEKIGRTLFG